MIIFVCFQTFITVSGVIDPTRRLGCEFFIWYSVTTCALKTCGFPSLGHKKG